MQNRIKLKLKTSLFGCLAVLAGMAFNGSAYAADADPFAGQVWHAVTPSWPGTIVFDGSSHKVKLEPIGSDAINAKYSYTLKPAAKVSGVDIIEGTLTMTNTVNQVSQSQFKIEGHKKLTLKFSEGKPEYYVRMTKAEEDAERARLQRMLQQGKVKPITITK